MFDRKARFSASAVIAILLLAAGPACSKKAAETGWQAVVDVVDGVRTIRNPETPRYGTFVPDLAEDLAIGDEKDDRYFLPGWVSIDIDQAGTIYACDTAKW